MSVVSRRMGTISADPRVARESGPMAGPSEPDAGTGRPPIEGEVRLRAGRQETASQVSGPGIPDRAAPRKPWSTLRQWSSSTISDMKPIRERNPMSPRHRELHTMVNHPGSHVTCPGSNSLQHHMHLRGATLQRSHVQPREVLDQEGQTGAHLRSEAEGGVVVTVWVPR
jgi:hypothetical protein